MAEPSSSIPDLLEKTLSKITESETQTPVTIPSPDCPGWWGAGLDHFLKND
jgi:hypothetical protein